MVFPSLPVYLDPPNWHHQQLNHHQQGSAGTENPQLPPPIPTPTTTDHHHHHHHHGGLGPGSVRAVSTADRARLANIKTPQPEVAQKCPRCESTNTKFCYYNNYSLTQPRHFCKTCRRYWTRGGALRSVPVGGGCRRNKKKKSSTGTNSSSKSTASADQRQQSGSNSTNNPVIPSEITAHLPHQTPHLSFMASLQNFTQYGMGNLGLNFGGIQGQIGTTSTAGQADMGFQIGTNSDILSVRSGSSHQPFPFFEPNNGLYPLQSEYMEASPNSLMVGETQFLRSTSPPPGSRVTQRAGPVKVENNNQGLNLTRPLLGDSENQNNQYWGGNNWTDLSGLK